LRWALNRHLDKALTSAACTSTKARAEHDPFGPVREAVEVTIVDKSDPFVLRFSKRDLMFARTSLDAVRLPHAKLAKPGVRLMRETITVIDPRMRLERLGQK
jgi:hypothetical protein